MGKLEKVIVLSVLAVIAVILVVSLTLDDPLNKDKVVMAGGSATKTQAAEAAAQAPAQNKTENVNRTASAAPALPETKTPAPIQAPGAQAPAGAQLAAAANADKAVGAAPSPLLNSTVAPAKQDAPAAGTLAGVPPGSILKASDGLQESYLSDMRFYTWQSGDSFRSVAAKYYGDPNRFTILRRSNEGREIIQPGEKILVPVFDLDAPRPSDALAAAPAAAAPATGKAVPHAKDSTSATPAAHKAADGSAGPRVHTVLDGESLWKIAKLELGDGARWNEIFEANRDVLSKPEAVHTGLKLRIPVK